MSRAKHAGRTPPPVEGAVPLSTLREGDRGQAHTAQLACEDCDLLNAMGLTDKCEVRVCRNGEPCIVQVQSTRLGLSAALAQRIFVTIERARPMPKAAIE